MKFQMGVGCTYCNLTGYRGRAAIYELLELDRGLADAIRRGNATEFTDLARSRPGFTSLAAAALDLVANGTTSIAEAIAVASGLDENEIDVPQAETVSQTDVDSLLEDVLAETRSVPALQQ
jgi:MSHA biogenesis protein MshE